MLVCVVWKMVPICILWCVWKERNLRCFEDLENFMENIVASFLHLLYLWHPCLLAFLIFLFVFLCLLRRFLVYTSSVLRGAPYAFFFLYIKFHLLIKKKDMLVSRLFLVLYLSLQWSGKMPLSSIHSFNNCLPCIHGHIDFTEVLILVHVQINVSMILLAVHTMLHLKCFIDLTVLKQIYGVSV
jgi:hypothetical protein